MDEFETTGSGWMYDGVSHLLISINQYSPLTGRSYIPLPEKLKRRGGILNIVNYDRRCFVWCILASLFPVESTNDYSERPESYPQNVHEILNLKDICMPMKLSDMNKFQVQNPTISITVFTYNKKTDEIEGPIFHAKEVKRHHINLLYLSKPKSRYGHYCLIKDLSRICRSNVTAHKEKMFICQMCLNHFSSVSKLDQHKIDCSQFDHVKTSVPSGSDSFLKFTSHKALLKKPFIIAADFESLTVPIKSKIKNKNFETSFTDIYQEHEAFSVGYVVLSSIDPSFNKFEMYRAESPKEQTPAAWFVSKILSEAENITNILNDRDLPMKNLTKEQQIHHDSLTKCPVCDEIFSDGNQKVYHHDHNNGDYISGYCNECNLKTQRDYSITVYLHNLSRYDAHIFISELAKVAQVNIIPLDMENYISFSIFCGKMKISFFDSFRCLPSSLESLVNNLESDQLKITKFFFPNEEEFTLLRRKQVFCYDYFDNWDRCLETKLPDKNKFFNRLRNEEISDDDYSHAETVWNKFGIKTLGEYSDLYLKLDCILLCDVLENFRDLTMEHYGLDAAYFPTAPSLSWAAALLTTKIKLKLFDDIEMYLFIEKSLRGGITQSIHRHAKANNPYCSDFDVNEKIKYLIYWDINSQYGFSQCASLPFDDFRWVSQSEIDNFDVNCSSYHEDSDKSCILEVSLLYPESIHNSHASLPFCPQHMIPPTSKGKCKKLLTTLYPKSKYVIHLNNLRQALAHGLILSKIHRILEFSQKPWLKPFITLNTKLRMESKSVFGKNYFKLIINSNFGKTMENQRKKRIVKLVNNWNSARKYISRPEFKNVRIFNENLIAIEMKKTNVLLNKPIYLGFCILDLSKTLLYDFHYDYVKHEISKFFQAKLMYCDTDSLIYEFTKLDDGTNFTLYDIIRRDAHSKFDTSDLPIDNIWGIELVNKKVPGKMKDELNGKILKEFISLRAKVYTYSTENSANKNNVKLKGIAKSASKQLTSQDFYDCLFEKQEKKKYCNFNTIRSKNHRLFSVNINKIGLNASDDKRYVMQSKVDTLPWGHYSIND